MGTVTGCVNPPILASLLHQAHLVGLRKARSRLRSGNTAAHRDVVHAHPLGGPSWRRHGIQHFLQNPTHRLFTGVHLRLIVNRVPAGMTARIVRHSVVRSLEVGEHRANIGDIRGEHRDALVHQPMGAPRHLGRHRSGDSEHRAIQLGGVGRCRHRARPVRCFDHAGRARQGGKQAIAQLFIVPRVSQTASPNTTGATKTAALCMGWAPGGEMGQETDAHRGCAGVLVG